MGSFLKPDKAKVIATVAFLIADYVGGFVSRLAMLAVAGGNAAGTYGGNGTYAGRAAGMMNGGARMGSGGLISGAVNLVILAVLFYVIVSFVMDKFARNPAGDGSKSGK